MKLTTQASPTTITVTHITVDVDFTCRGCGTKTGCTITTKAGKWVRDTLKCAECYREHRVIIASDRKGASLEWLP